MECQSIHAALPRNLGSCKLIRFFFNCFFVSHFDRHLIGSTHCDILWYWRNCLCPRIGNFSFPFDAYIIVMLENCCGRCLFQRVLMFNLIEVIDQLSASLIYEKQILHVARNLKRICDSCTATWAWRIW